MRLLGSVVVAFVLACATPAFAGAAQSPDCGVAAVLGLGSAECQPAQPSVPMPKTACPPTSSTVAQYFVSDDFTSGSATSEVETVTTLSAPPVDRDRGEPAPTLAIGLALLAVAGVGAVAVRIVRD
ncbi:hypothetical protein [Allokutzneria oryzae]|uniref:Gram-positive cocci surface proteins LPxTG domain-containing protein n=1 Tax=Allokutzneria oryzae TaxID=1378989 RepID=A0ABV5ZVM9_9PSEU